MSAPAITPDQARTMYVNLAKWCRDQAKKCTEKHDHGRARRYRLEALDADAKAAEYGRQGVARG